MPFTRFNPFSAVAFFEPLKKLLIFRDRNFFRVLPVVAVRVGKLAVDAVVLRLQLIAYELSEDRHKRFGVCVFTGKVYGLELFYEIITGFDRGDIIGRRLPLKRKLGAVATCKRDTRKVK